MTEFCSDIHEMSAALEKATENEPTFVFEDLQNLQHITNTPRANSAQEEVKTTESDRRLKKKTTRP